MKMITFLNPPQNIPLRLSASHDTSNFPIRNVSNSKKLIFTFSLLLSNLLYGAPATADLIKMSHDPDIGKISLSDIPLNSNFFIRSATYTPSGKVLISYSLNHNDDKRRIRLAVMNDDGSNLLNIYDDIIPSMKLDNGIRYIIFPDNKKILLGDYILECAPSIDKCNKTSLLNLEYPDFLYNQNLVSHRWSEVIISPDNTHISWTSLIPSLGAIEFIGVISKEKNKYTIKNISSVSDTSKFVKDPLHFDGVLPTGSVGGEVKQFVHGGTALSIVGAIHRDTPDSVIQNLITMEETPITNTPGYNETTILSPDEHLGITMSTRFSSRTDLGILGLLPRPYPAHLNMGVSMYAYVYSVIGVRGKRSGNIGPVLININKSINNLNYIGNNLNRSEEWVFHSPISWSPNNKKAIWIEGKRETNLFRIAKLELPNYSPQKSISVSNLPSLTSTIPLSNNNLKKLADGSSTINAKVYGKASGFITYNKNKNIITKEYYKFSDDGSKTLNGIERFESVPSGDSTYTAKISLTGSEIGRMNLKITFGKLQAALPAKIRFDKDSHGTPLSYGYSCYNNTCLNIENLKP